MSSDLHFTEEGDLALSAAGDIALTEDAWRDHSQQAFIRLRTSIGDYLLYPGLGADLDSLIGEPQSQETGKRGEFLIHRALVKDSRLSSFPISVKSTPISYSSIRFDVYMTVGSREELVLSISQDLGSDDEIQQIAERSE